MSSSPETKLNLAARVALLAILLAIGGCQDYAARRDTIAFHAGEAVAYNKAVHTIDPWPAAAARTDIDFDGRRIVRVIERYEAGGGAAAVSSPAPAGVPAPAPGAAPR